MLLTYDETGRVVRIHYKPWKLPQEQIDDGLMAEELPEPTPLPNEMAILYVNPETEEVYYVYEEREPTDEERIQLLESVVDMMLGEGEE